MGAILIVLALGLTLRVIIAYLLPGSGFEVDLGAFRFWASDLATNGPFGFYERDFFHDYTPGYLYVLWLVGLVGEAVGGIGDLIKVPPILADLAIGWLVWSMVRELGGSDRAALAAALVAVFNPISWFDSVVWGQVDAFGVVFLLLALRSLWRDRPERAAIFTVVAAIIKPQLGILVPLVAVVTIRRALWPVRDDDAGAVPAGAVAPGSPGVLDRLRAWERRTGSPVRILTTGFAGYLTAVLISLPFGLSVIELAPQAPFIASGLVDQIVIAGGGYPYLTVNAYNAWALVPGDLGHSLANAGLWVCDAVQTPADRCGAGVAAIGPVPAVVVGAVLLVAALGIALWVAARHPDRLTLLVVLGVLALAFFAVPTRVHERYGFPFFALAAILFAISFRWRIAYVVLSIATFANMYVVLTTLYPDNPSIADWLGIGEVIRSQAGIVAVALCHTLAFGWVVLQLRSDARARLADELAQATAVGDPSGSAPGVATEADVVDDPWASAGRPATGSRPDAVDSRPPGDGIADSSLAVGVTGTTLAAGTAGGAWPDRPAGSAEGTGTVGASLPTWSAARPFSEAGLWGWFRDRVGRRPARADRSAALAGERGGRLDRLDAWFLVVLVVATMGMRTFRLAEPYEMHFDEVYHARTAAEFLQGWRYDLDHDIYEWTHPHLAKYVMAGGLVAWGSDHVRDTSKLDVPVVDAAIEPRRDDPFAGERSGERVHVLTGSEVRSYDLRDRALIGIAQAPGSTSIAIDPNTDQLIIGDGDGGIATLDLATIGLTGVDDVLEPVELGRVDHPVTHLLASDDGSTILAASDARLTAVDALSGLVLGSSDLSGIADLAPAGTGAAIVGVPDAIDDVAAVSQALADLIGGDALDYEDRLTEATDPADQVVLGSPGSGDDRTAVEDAIGDGTLAGLEIVELPRVGVATDAGVTFIDPATAAVTESLAMAGGAHGLALVTGIDDPRLYVTTGDPDEPAYEVVAVGGDEAADGPVTKDRHPLPGPGTMVTFDEASQMVHILGRVPGGTGSAAGGWTVYVVEPHGNAVFADAALPSDMTPTAWAMDVQRDRPATDRQELLVFGADGLTAAIDVGSHAFAWRLPGVIAGVLMAVALYVLARILFRRRLIAGLVAAFVAIDGMLFVQSRIGMNDVYVGLFLIAAYAVFAAVWTGWWRGRGAFWLSMPIIGLLLGLALASKWVAAYAIGALILLLLIRSALGRVVAIIGLIGISSVLGYIAISVPEGQGIGNITFLVIMVGLTLAAVVVAVVHPIAWTDEEQWLALIVPAGVGALVFFGTLATGSLDTTFTLGSIEVTPLQIAILSATGSLVVAGAFLLGRRLGYGPLAVPPSPGEPAALLDPPAAPPIGWLRPGALAGIPLVWAAVCLVAIPLAVYVASYIPWALIGNHQLWEGMPAGNTGQTLVALTGQMYGYHNGLTAPHPASSPWWAWPFDLKPVWFYQDSFADVTTAAIYDSGNLVIWWLGAVALVFVAIQAFRRRSLALALIGIAFAAQWIPWARIDRAAFQYHYYTALPFVILALAYFVAELWHGASRRTWLMARIAAGVAIVAPAAMWILSRPLCAFVGVESVNPGSAACPAVIPDFVLTVRTAGLLIVVAVGAVVLGRALLSLQRDAEEDEPAEHAPSARMLLGAAIGVAIGLAVAQLLPDTPILTLTSVPVEPIALLVAIPLGYLGAQVVAARDARRYVVGLMIAAVAWFAVLYPNLSALPLPSAVANAYQGLLPTYLYAFQFPVGSAERNVDGPLLSPSLAILTAAIAVTCLVVAYSAASWRLALAGSDAPTPAASTGSGSAGPRSGPGSGPSPDDGLARSGGDA